MKYIFANQKERILRSKTLWCYIIDCGEISRGAVLSGVSPGSYTNTRQRGDYLFTALPPHRGSFLYLAVLYPCQNSSREVRCPWIESILNAKKVLMKLTGISGMVLEHAES